MIDALRRFPLRGADNEYRASKTTRQAGIEKATTAKPSTERDPFAGVSPKLSALLHKHFAREGRAERIARAAKAWDEAVEIASTFKNIEMKHEVDRAVQGA